MLFDGFLSLSAYLSLSSSSSLFTFIPLYLTSIIENVCKLRCLCAAIKINAIVTRIVDAIAYALHLIFRGKLDSSVHPRLQSRGSIKMDA